MSDALLEAIQTRDVDRLAALLAAGADPNTIIISHYYTLELRLTPLQAAIGELAEFGEDDPGGPRPAGPIDAVILLLRHGARVNGWDVNKEGDPLLTAVFMNHIKAVQLLLAHGADPYVRDDEGYSPLRICVEKGYLEMAQLLLRCGANKTIHDAGGPSGMNALGLAVDEFDAEMVKMLLAHGADPHVQDADRMTVFDHLRLMDTFGRLPEDPADQDRLREIRRLLGDPPV